LQVAPVQQPLHELVLQTQLPLTHCWPAAQGPLLPHLQPPLVQLSALMELQATQFTPPVPQVANTDELQVVPLQQPLHEVALHWQLPPTHCWPEAQGTFSPQRQAPDAEQVSAVMPHTLQERPSTPQAPVELPALQEPPWQQPPSHAVWLAPPQEVEHT
jgi:hypothetical protein